MKIAIEASPLQFPLTGIGFYVEKLLEGLAETAPENEYFLMHWTREWTGPDFGGSFVPVSYGNGNAALGAATRLNRELKRIGADVFHATATTGVPPQGTVCPSAVTVHDLFPLYPDLDVSAVTRLKFKTLFSWCARNADLFICNSFHTRDELLKRYPSIGEAKTEVVYLAPTCGKPESAPAPEPDPDADPVLLCLGGIEKRKGQLFLLEVYREIVKENPDVPSLVFAGEDRGDGAELSRRMDAYGLGGKVEVFGYVSEEEKRALLARTKIMLIPSLYEGFGIPLLDAMRLGLPFVASDIPPFREIAHEGAPLVPLDAAAWREAVSSALSAQAAERRTGVEKGKARAGDFTWRKCAEKTLETLRALIA